MKREFARPVKPGTVVGLLALLLLAGGIVQRFASLPRSHIARLPRVLAANPLASVPGVAATPSRVNLPRSAYQPGEEYHPGILPSHLACSGAARGSAPSRVSSRRVDRILRSKQPEEYFPACYSALVTPGSQLALARSRGAAEPVTVDAELPGFKPRESKLSGQLKSVGSDTMNNLMTLWAEEFRKHYPQVNVAVEGKGSSTAPPALIAGTANLGPMSREMKPSEIDAFEKKFGYKPTALGVSIDMLAVYVNKDNPLQSLTLTQVDAIFSKARKLGQAKDVRLWGELGLNDAAWAGRNISLYGRNAASGTYGYFKEHALGNGDFKDTVKEQPGSSSVVQGISRDRYGIGYSGIGYRTADVRPLALAPAADAEPVPAEPQYAYSGEYPLARMLLVYLNVAAGKPLDPLRSEFVRFIFSKEGQQVVLRDGYLPVTAAMAQEALESIGLATP